MMIIDGFFSCVEHFRIQLMAPRNNERQRTARLIADSTDDTWMIFSVALI